MTTTEFATEFRDALTKRGFDAKEGRFEGGLYQVATITKGGTYTMKVTVNEHVEQINIYITDGADLGCPMLDNATFSTKSRPSAFERALKFVDSYR